MVLVFLFPMAHKAFLKNYCIYLDMTTLQNSKLLNAFTGTLLTLVGMVRDTEIHKQRQRKAFSNLTDISS